MQLAIEHLRCKAAPKLLGVYLYPIPHLHIYKHNLSYVKQSAYDSHIRIARFENLNAQLTKLKSNRLHIYAGAAELYG